MRWSSRPALTRNMEIIMLQADNHSTPLAARSQDCGAMPDHNHAQHATPPACIPNAPNGIVESPAHFALGHSVSRRAFAMNMFATVTATTIATVPQRNAAASTPHPDAKLFKLGAEFLAAAEGVERAEAAFDEVNDKVHEAAWQSDLCAGVPENQDDWTRADADKWWNALCQAVTNVGGVEYQERSRMLDEAWNRMDRLGDEIKAEHATTAEGFGIKAFVIFHLCNHLWVKETGDLDLDQLMCIDLLKQLISAASKIFPAAEMATAGIQIN